MIGFAFFMFEGITCLLPVINESQDLTKIPKIIILSLTSLCIMHIIFASICYYSWGNDLTEPVVTQMLPAANYAVEIVSILFMINLVFSYPMSIFVANQTLAAFILDTKEETRLGY